MTGYTVHTGSTEDFSTGWDRIFGGDKKKEQKPKVKSPKAKDKKSKKK